MRLTYMILCNFVTVEILGLLNKFCSKNTIGGNELEYCVMTQPLRFSAFNRHHTVASHCHLHIYSKIYDRCKHGFLCLTLYIRCICIRILKRHVKYACSCSSKQHFIANKICITSRVYLIL